MRRTDRSERDVAIDVFTPLAGLLLLTASEGVVGLLSGEAFRDLLDSQQPKVGEVLAEVRTATGLSETAMGTWTEVSEDWCKVAPGSGAMAWLALFTRGRATLEARYPDDVVPSWLLAYGRACQLEAVVAACVLAIADGGTCDDKRFGAALQAWRGAVEIGGHGDPDDAIRQAYVGFTVVHLPEILAPESHATADAKDDLRSTTERFDALLHLWE